MISLTNICKSYQGRPVLSRVNLTVPDGGVVRVQGPNGVGKSTLLAIVLGLVAADSGRIEGTTGRRRAAVFQENRLLPWLSPVDNLRLVVPHLARPQAEGLLRELGLPADALSLPAANLSGGQQRRVAIARALAVPADFVCLDEPFTGIDAASLPNLTAEVATRLRGRDLLLVTHSDAEAEPFEPQSLWLGEGSVAGENER